MVLLDMEMPISCKDCDLRDSCDNCSVTWENVADEVDMDIKAESCPIKAEISKNATNGDVIKAMFPNTEFLINESLGEKGTVFFESDENVILYSLDWWNALWERTGKCRLKLIDVSADQKIFSH
jgi:hypothetical protein